VDIVGIAPRTVRSGAFGNNLKVTMVAQDKRGEFLPLIKGVRRDFIK
jgi:hypothetical protein